MNLKNTIIALIVMSASALAQTITVTTNVSTPSWPSSFGTAQGTPSSAYYFKVSGTSLTAGVAVTLSDGTNWAISTNNGSTWTNTATLASNVNNLSLYARMTGTNIGTFTNTITLASAGASNRTVTSVGTVAQALASVMYDKNTDTIVKPATATWPGLVIPQAETYTRIQTVFAWPKSSNTREVSGANAEAGITNGIASLFIPATNAGTSVSAIRLHGYVDSIGPAGVSTRFTTNHVAWISWDGNGGGTNFTTTWVLGNNANTLTNIGVFPPATNRAVAIQVRYNTNGTHEARLRANNGTNQTNGPWVTLASIFNRVLMGLEQRNNGAVNLWRGTESANPSIISTISNGPTTLDNTGDTAFEVRHETTGTNTGNPQVLIYDAEVHIIP